MNHVTGVCCVVFDIDGMLFEVFMNFVNIEKKIAFICQYFMFSSRFMLFPTFQKKIGVQIFCRKTIISHFIWCFMLFSTLQK